MNKPLSGVTKSGRLGVLLLLIVATLALAPLQMVHAASSGGDDPLGGFSDAVETNGSNWVALMMAIAAIVVTGAIYYGSSNAMKWVGRFIGGTFFALLATMGPRGILDFLSALFRFGNVQH